jgi:hypothetical protein
MFQTAVILGYQVKESKYKERMKERKEEKRRKLKETKL